MALPVRRDNEIRRWDPFEQLEDLHRQVSSLLASWPRPAAPGDDVFTPLADVEETDSEYVVEIEVPGVRRDDVAIELAGRRLTVTGERKERERVGVLRRRTRVRGRFHYEVTLPGAVDEDGVDARLVDGVLTVRVPKAAVERPRRVEVVEGR